MGIVEHLGEIADRWTTEANKAASARGLSRPELTNVMPGYISALVRGAPLPEVRALIQSHLADRIRLGFDLPEMIEELSLLERCFAAVIAELPEGERPPQAERDRLFGVLQDAIVGVSEVFQEHMLLDEQREKRFQRRLEAIASAALHDPQTPLRARLREAMQVVIEAMSADAAAILLFEPETEQLITYATIGAGEEELARYATGLSLASFAGQIVAQNDPVFVADAATTELEVSEPLRRSGIHALLGVRLPRRLRLMGVMYVGIRERRAFIPREIARLELLGDRLTLHLDHAQLHAELRERIEELGVERALHEQLVALLAHDLRGPLSAARMRAELLAKSGRRPSSDDLFRITRNLDRADRMIRDLLDVSRVRAGKRLPVEVEPCDLRGIAQHVVEELRSTLGDRFDLDAPASVQGIWSPDALHRALWNLGVNAVKHGALDGRVAVRVERRGEEARLSVHNAGDPIAAEDQTHLFDAFVRGRKALRGEQSWGLGLAIVRACAEAHGGSVSVESTAEAGTTFAISLPMDARPHVLAA